uniref:Ecotropic viral integration site 5 like n=1 Tax=Molossus molossus TaxID=27622 RepID=A0A7J8I706_MOLMO|nr:ecotropic viral integration site 5 like [Molossus molossus]
MSLPTMASPTLSPDSSSQEALSAPTCSPTSDSENLSPDELELLAKLEEQNRLLEADSKSMRSMNGSRRNSGSSLVSSSSASSNLSHLEEDTWILWGRIANEWEEWRRRKEKLLKELIRKGIPHHFRAIVWQHCRTHSTRYRPAMRASFAVWSSPPRTARAAQTAMQMSWPHPIARAWTTEALLLSPKLGPHLNSTLTPRAQQGAKGRAGA